MARNYELTEWPLFAFLGPAESAVYSLREEGVPGAENLSASKVEDSITAAETESLLRAGAAFETAVLSALPKADKAALFRLLTPSEIAYGVYATLSGEGYSGRFEEVLSREQVKAIASLVRSKKPKAYATLEAKLDSLADRAARRCCKSL